MTDPHGTVSQPSQRAYLGWIFLACAGLGGFGVWIFTRGDSSAEQKERLAEILGLVSQALEPLESDSQRIKVLTKQVVVLRKETDLFVAAAKDSETREDVREILKLAQERRQENDEFLNTVKDKMNETEDAFVKMSLLQSMQQYSIILSGIDIAIEELESALVGSEGS